MRLLLPYLVFLFPHLILAQTENNFINPPIPGATGDFSQNEIWQLGSTVTIKWLSNFTAFNLIMLQSNDIVPGLPGDHAGGVSIYTGSPSRGGQQESSFTWTVTTTLNFITYPVFWFQLYNSTDTSGEQVNSHYFNITGPASAVSSASSTSSPINSPTETQKTSPSSGLSTGAKAGIGVGIPVLVILVAAMIGGWWYRRRVRRAGIAQEETSEYAKPELGAEEARRNEIGGDDRAGLGVNEGLLHELEGGREVSETAPPMI